VSGLLAFLLGAIFGVLVCGIMCLGLIRLERRRPWWRS
jgi:hypothetical protein